MKTKHNAWLVLMAVVLFITAGCAILKEQIKLREAEAKAEHGAMQDKMDNFNANPDNPDLMVCKKKMPTGSHRPQTECKIIKNGKREKDLNYTPEVAEAEL